MSTPAPDLYRRHRSPPEIITHAVWLYFRFPLSLRAVEEMRATHGVNATLETYANGLRNLAGISPPAYAVTRPPLPTSGVSMRSSSPSPARSIGSGAAVNQDGFVLDVLIQRRQDRKAVKRLMRKLLRKMARAPLLMITDKLTHWFSFPRGT